MNKAITAMVGGLCLVGLVGCQGWNKQQIGTVTGGVIGGVVGSTFGGGAGHIVGAVGGTIVGAFIGNAFGKHMDDVDRLKMREALERNRSQEASTWRNPDTGTTYTVVPKKTYYNASKQPCREYTTSAIIGGKRQHVYGTACRMKDGSWRTQS